MSSVVSILHTSHVPIEKGKTERYEHMKQQQTQNGCKGKWEDQWESNIIDGTSSTCI
jgi:hypothetical protein